MFNVLMLIKFSRDLFFGNFGLFFFFLSLTFSLFVAEEETLKRRQVFFIYFFIFFIFFIFLPSGAFF